jgi:quinol monooxygenase YgiN
LSASRREALAGGLAIAMLGAIPASAKEGSAMYGLIGKMTAREGQRDALIAILTKGSGSMPGCRSYIVAKDAKDANGIWVTEVWDRPEDHAASLRLPSVQAAIREGKPLIAGFDSYFETEPVGGTGL